MSTTATPTEITATLKTYFIKNLPKIVTWSFVLTLVSIAILASSAMSLSDMRKAKETNTLPKQAYTYNAITTGLAAVSTVVFISMLIGAYFIQKKQPGITFYRFSF